MRVFYENMRDKVDKVIDHAASQNIAIERIELTSTEFSAFLRDSGTLRAMPPGIWQPGFCRETVWRGIRITENQGQ